MSNFYDNLKKAKQGIHMSAAAKQKGKEQLLHFMRAHEALNTPVARGASTSWFGSRSIVMRTGTAFALFVVIGGGTSLAASNSLPGDALYAVKLNVNEKIQAAAAFSATSGARLDTELAAKRLSEASQLSLEGRMNAEAEATIATNFEKFADRAETKIAILKTAGNAEVAADLEARFESALSAHASILARLEAEGEPNVEPIRAKIYGVLASMDGRNELASKFSVDAAMEVRVKDPQDASPAVDAEGRVKAASGAVAAVKRYVAARGNDISAVAKTDAETRIRNAESLIIDAKADVRAGLPAEAAAKAGRALRVANETKVRTEAQLHAASKTTLNFLAVDPAAVAAGGDSTAAIMVDGAPGPSTSSGQATDPDADMSTSTDPAAGSTSSPQATPSSSNLNLDGSTYLRTR